MRTKKRLLSLILVLALVLTLIPGGIFSLPVSAATYGVTLQSNNPNSYTVTRGDILNLSWTNMRPNQARNNVCYLLVKTEKNNSTATALIANPKLTGTTGDSTTYNSWKVTLLPGTYWVEVRALRGSTYTPADNIAAQGMWLTVLAKPISDPGLPANMRNITTMQQVYDMGLGINLGNTFDSAGDWITSAQQQETAWGSPVITEAMIAKYAEAGFRSVRIPVTWSNINVMLQNYTINPYLLDRVQQVVDWVIGNGMYAIVNMHHDSFVGTLFPTDEIEAFKKYEAIWTQICERFKGYNDYLMFESLNEPGFDTIWNQYDGGNNQNQKRAFDMLNRINQQFVDIVRSSGGSNAYRHLLISTYYTNIDHSTNGLTKVPNDPRGRCAMSVHYYTPWNWVGLEKDESWGKAQWEWGTPQDIKFLQDELDKVYNYYVTKGVPVIIGEYGMCSVKNKHDSDLWTIMVADETFKRNMCPMLWDVQLTNEQLLQPNAFYDRRTLTFVNQEVLAGFQAISATRNYTK
jgi:endoglucanase